MAVDSQSTRFPPMVNSCIFFAQKPKLHQVAPSSILDSSSALFCNPYFRKFYELSIAVCCCIKQSAFTSCMMKIPSMKAWEQYLSLRWMMLNKSLSSASPRARIRIVEYIVIDTFLYVTFRSQFSVLISIPAISSSTLLIHEWVDVWTAIHKETLVEVASCMYFSVEWTICVWAALSMWRESFSLVVGNSQAVDRFIGQH